MSRIKLTTTGFPSESQLDQCIPTMKKEMLKLDIKFEDKIYTFQYVNNLIHIQEGRNYSNERIKDILYGFTIYRYPHTFYLLEVNVMYFHFFLIIVIVLCIQILILFIKIPFSIQTHLVESKRISYHTLILN